MNVKFRVGRVMACVSEEDAARLLVVLLERDTPSATKVASVITRAVKEQVLDAG